MRSAISSWFWTYPRRKTWVIWLLSRFLNTHTFRAIAWKEQEREKERKRTGEIKRMLHDSNLAEILVSRTFSKSNQLSRSVSVTSFKYFSPLWTMGSCWLWLHYSDGAQWGEIYFQRNCHINGLSQTWWLAPRFLGISVLIPSSPKSHLRLSGKRDKFERSEHVIYDILSCCSPANLPRANVWRLIGLLVFPSALPGLLRLRIWSKIPFSRG